MIRLVSLRMWQNDIIRPIRWRIKASKMKKTLTVYSPFFIFILHSHQDLVSIDTCDLVIIPKIPTDLLRVISFFYFKWNVLFFGEKKKLLWSTNSIIKTKQDKLRFYAYNAYDVNGFFLTFYVIIHFLITHCFSHSIYYIYTKGKKRERTLINRIKYMLYCLQCVFYCLRFQIFAVFCKLYICKVYIL